MKSRLANKMNLLLNNVPDMDCCLERCYWQNRDYLVRKWHRMAVFWGDDFDQETSHIWACTDTYLYLYLYLYIYGCVYIYTCLYVDPNLNPYLYIYRYIYIYRYVYIYIYLYNVYLYQASITMYLNLRI